LKKSRSWFLPNNIATTNRQYKISARPVRLHLLGIMFGEYEITPRYIGRHPVPEITLNRCIKRLQNKMIKNRVRHFYLERLGRFKKKLIESSVDYRWRIKRNRVSQTGPVSVSNYRRFYFIKNVRHRWFATRNFFVLKTKKFRELWASYYSRRGKMINRKYNNFNSNFFAGKTHQKLLTRFFRLRRAAKRNGNWWRFVRKYNAFIAVTALRNNIFLYGRQGDIVVPMHTGLFEELRHGTKRKRTQLTGWYMTDRFNVLMNEIIKKKTTFFINFWGKSGARSGVFKSWRYSTEWRLLRIYSKTPVAFNGTRPRRKRRL
jgi:hypothetical protein